MKKIIITILSLIMSISVCAGMCLIVNADTPENDNEYIITCKGIGTYVTLYINEQQVFCVELDMESTFNGCSSLVDIPSIPSGVKNMTSTFSGCESLITIPEIPDSVEIMDHTFFGCSSLIDTPVIPDNVLSIKGIFDGCKFFKDK